jgi:hypothetical protein
MTGYGAPQKPQEPNIDFELDVKVLIKSGKCVLHTKDPAKEDEIKVKGSIDVKSERHSQVILANKDEEGEKCLRSNARVSIQPQHGAQEQRAQAQSQQWQVEVLDEQHGLPC